MSNNMILFLILLAVVGGAGAVEAALIGFAIGVAALIAGGYALYWWLDRDVRADEKAHEVTRQRRTAYMREVEQHLRSLPMKELAYQYLSVVWAERRSGYTDQELRDHANTMAAKWGEKDVDAMIDLLLETA